MKNKRILFVMDDIDTINIKKDSTWAMIQSAKTKGFIVFYAMVQDLFMLNARAFGNLKQLDIADVSNNKKHYEIIKKKIMEIRDFDAVFMRVDPPVDDLYVYATYVLDRIQEQNAQVINPPQALRNFNEKVVINNFKDIITDTLICTNIFMLKDFLHKHKTIIIKPLDGMGGKSIFKVKENDSNANVIFETMLHNKKPVMAQRYIKEIKTTGDKRILLINGTPSHYALQRMPQGIDHRGNLATGGSAIACTLNEQDKKICKIIKPFLQKHNIVFAGIDVIGDYLTEINITSPTCIVEINKQKNYNIADKLIETFA
jgi:glutathione synthase